MCSSPLCHAWAATSVGSRFPCFSKEEEEPARCLPNFSGCAKSSLEGDQRFRSLFSADPPAMEREPEA